jgi:hypothetical protein
MIIAKERRLSSGNTSTDILIDIFHETLRIEG